MTPKHLASASWALLALGLTVTSAAPAATNQELNNAIQLNLTSPGARGLALGGAFTALADDATAAYANPAGLATLSRPELATEVRGFEFTHVFSERGHEFGPVSGKGIDVVQGIEEGSLDDTAAGLAFVSYVYPWKSWAIALYRHELANLKARVRTEGPIWDDKSGGSAFSSRIMPVEGNLDLGIDNSGVSAAFRRPGSRWSVGLGLSVYDFAIDAVTRRYLPPFGFSEPCCLEQVWLPAETSDERLWSVDSFDGTDRDTAWNAGVLWRDREERRGGRVSVGAAWREGPDFTYDLRIALPGLAAPGEPVEEGVLATGFRVPDVLSLGFAFQNEAFTVSLDVNRIFYSRFLDDFALFRGDPPVQPELDRYVLDDGTELRIGFEYLWRGARAKSAVAFRLGAWRDPDHRIRYEGNLDRSGGETEEILFRGGDDELHVTGGLGWTSGGRLQVDLGFDLSELVKTAAVSAVARF